MNYTQEINAFYIEVETNPLSTGAGMLWHRLLHINNRACWVKEISTEVIPGWFRVMKEREQREKQKRVSS